MDAIARVRAVRAAIRRAREEHGMALREFAARMGMVVSSAHQLETSGGSMDLGTLFKAADALGVPPSELVAAAEGVSKVESNPPPPVSLDPPVRTRNRRTDATTMTIAPCDTTGGAHVSRVVKRLQAGRRQLDRFVVLHRGFEFRAPAKPAKAQQKRILATDSKEFARDRLRDIHHGELDGDLLEAQVMESRQIRAVPGEAVAPYHLKEDLIRDEVLVESDWKTFKSHTFELSVPRLILRPGHGARVVASFCPEGLYFYQTAYVMHLDRGRAADLDGSRRVLARICALLNSKLFPAWIGEAAHPERKISIAQLGSLYLPESFLLPTRLPDIDDLLEHLTSRAAADVYVHPAERLQRSACSWPQFERKLERELYRSICYHLEGIDTKLRDDFHSLVEQTQGKAYLTSLMEQDQ